MFVIYRVGVSSSSPYTNYMQMLAKLYEDVGIIFEIRGVNMQIICQSSKPTLCGYPLELKLCPSPSADGPRVSVDRVRSGDAEK
jgi:hypothetical protein